MAKKTPPPRTELLGLLAECKAHIADDAVRLVLADWLEEHGDEADRARAEFIRLECQIARLNWDDEDRKVLAVRVKELEQRYAQTWLGPLHGRGWRCWFLRGLLQITIPAKSLTRWMEELAGSEAWAWVENLELTGVTPSNGRQLVDCSLLGEPARLTVRLKGAGTLKELLGCPHLRTLLRLSLSHNRLGDDDAIALAASPNLSGLEEPLRKAGLQRCRRHRSWSFAPPAGPSPPDPVRQPRWRRRRGRPGRGASGSATEGAGPEFLLPRQPRSGGAGRLGPPGQHR
jgi:uncharacterized protein (TIGR02996 family)